MDLKKTENNSHPGGANKPVKKRRGFWGNLAYRFVKEKRIGLIGLFLVAALFFVGIFADWLAPEDYNNVRLDRLLQPPSAENILGTDHLGRDVLSRVIYGARLSMIIGVVATTIHTVISTALGMLSAYVGGKFDLIFQRIVDAYALFPDLIILISIMSIVGPGLTTILLVLGINNGLQGIRGKRALVFMIKENLYVSASQAIGARRFFVMVHHLLPNIMPMIITVFALRMGGVIMAEAGLSFLGLGIPPPNPSWGGMISGEGRAYMTTAPWMMFWPGLALFVAILGINLLGDAMRDLLDPRMRGGVGSFRMKDTGKIIAKINMMKAKK